MCRESVDVSELERNPHGANERRTVRPCASKTFVRLGQAAMWSVWQSCSRSFHVASFQVSAVRGSAHAQCASVATLAHTPRTRRTPSPACVSVNVVHSLQTLSGEDPGFPYCGISFAVVSVLMSQCGVTNG